MTKATIQKLANDLGLSITTISFIMNDKGDHYKISKATQKRVKDYIQKLGYRPSSLARSLTTGRTYTIAYVVPDTANPFYAQIGKFLENCLFQGGYHLFMCGTEEDPEMERHIIDSLIYRHVDGVIMAPTGPASIEALQKKGLPLVTFDRMISQTAVNFVGIDNYKAAYDAFADFLQNGPQRELAIVSITPKVDTLAARIKGCKDALKDRGIKLPKERLLIVDYKNLAISSRDVLTAALENDQDIDTIFFTNNLSGLKGYHVLNKHFRSRLKKMKLISFDDFDFFELADPMMSGIAQPHEQIGQACGEMMLKLVKENKGRPEKIILPTTVNWR